MRRNVQLPEGFEGFDMEFEPTPRKQSILEWESLRRGDMFNLGGKTNWVVIRPLDAVNIWVIKDSQVGKQTRKAFVAHLLKLDASEIEVREGVGGGLRLSGPRLDQGSIQDIVHGAVSFEGRAPSTWVKNPAPVDEEFLEEVLGGYEDLPLDEMLALVAALKIPIKTVDFNNGTVYVIEYNREKYVIQDNYGTAYVVSINSFLDPALDHADDFVTVDDFDDFWESPSPLFHGTDQDNVESIMQSGLQADSVTRGLANRGVGAAVFTSLEPEKATEYGDAVFVVDTKSMRSDGFTPRVSGEPGIADYKAMEAIVYKVGMGDEYAVDMPDSSEDYDTVIVYSNIPAKYLTLL